jgi:hypothetical protein
MAADQRGGLMSRRISGAPRRPRNPVAKAVRTPAFRMKVEPDKRWKDRLQEEKKAETETVDPKGNTD